MADAYDSYRLNPATAQDPWALSGDPASYYAPSSSVSGNFFGSASAGVGPAAGAGLTFLGGAMGPLMGLGTGVTREFENLLKGEDSMSRMSPPSG